MQTQIRNLLSTLFVVGISMLLIPQQAFSSEGSPQRQEENKQIVTEHTGVGRWISTSAADIAVGDYGTGSNVTIAEISQTLKYRGQIGEVGVTVPYLFRRGGGVTAGESSRVRGGAIPNNAQGIGDVQLKGRYFWLEETDARPSVDLTARVKIPTASADKGLGTGRMDGGLGTGLAKHFGSLITFLDLEAVFRDRPSGSTIKPFRLDSSVGVGYSFTERFTAYASLDASTKSSSGVDAPLEVVLSGDYKLTDTASIQTYVLKGLSDGSPDYGGGIGLTLRF